MDIQKYKKEMFHKKYLGNFQDLRNYRIEIDFSYDFKDYYNSIGIPDFYHPSPNSAINNFIDNCLILGSFIYTANKFGIYEEDFSFNCTTYFYLSNIYKEYPEAINTKIALNAQKNGKVLIVVIKTYENIKIHHDLTICARRGLPMELLKMNRFKPHGPCKHQDGYYYGPIENKFISPYYDNLPLYINVPFMKEYARHMFKIGPPIPITYKPYKFLKLWI